MRRIRQRARGLAHDDKIRKQRPSCLAQGYWRDPAEEVRAISEKIRPGMSVDHEIAKSYEYKAHGGFPEGLSRSHALQSVGNGQTNLPRGRPARDSLQCCAEVVVPLMLETGATARRAKGLYPGINYRARMRSGAPSGASLANTRVNARGIACNAAKYLCSSPLPPCSHSYAARRHPHFGSRACLG